MLSVSIKPTQSADTLNAVTPSVAAPQGVLAEIVLQFASCFSPPAIDVIELSGAMIS